MKKCFLVLVILFIFSFFVGCGKKDGEYSLKIMTTNDLYNILSNEEKSFIFATLNSDDVHVNSFISSLTKLSKELKTNVYYVDAKFSDFWSDESLYVVTDNNTNDLYYYYVSGGKLVVNKKYSDYSNLYKDLKDYKSDILVNPMSVNEKKRYLADAKKMYGKGDIAGAFTSLSYAWDLKETRDFYSNHKYFKIINDWIYTRKKGNKYSYKHFAFYGVSDSIYYYSYDGTLEKFVQPHASMYESVYYYIKNDIIYVSDDNDEDKKNYKAKYEILELSDKELKLKDGDVYLDFRVKG